MKLKLHLLLAATAGVLLSPAGVASSYARPHHQHQYKHRKHHSDHVARIHHHQSQAGRSKTAAHDGQTGIASVYSTDSGNRTADGGRLNPGALTAAHRSLPFGTKVRVTNKSNGRSVVVTINDRGPFVRGRVIDLTPASAHALGFNGLAPVSLSVNPHNS
jgi:rare lipoprotein A